MAGYQIIGFNELVTSAYLNNKLMGQTVARFDSAGERNSAITSPENNQYAYVDGVGLTRWNGSGWVIDIGQTPTSYTATPINFTTFYSTWTAYAGGYTAPRYYKDVTGTVHLEGMMRAGTSSDIGEYAVVLPAGFRPAAAHIFPVWCRQGGSEKGCRVNINNIGQVQILGLSGDFRSATGDWLSLSGIVFRAA